MERDKGKLSEVQLHGYMEFLWDKMPPEKRDTCKYIDPVWYSMYSNKNYKEKVLGWMKNERLMNYRYVFVPICKWKHWRLVIFCNIGNNIKSETELPCIIILDSLEGSVPNELESEIRSLLLDIYKIEGRSVTKLDIARIKVIVPEVPRQKDNKSCGYFVLFYLDGFMRLCPSTFNKQASCSHFLNKHWFNDDDLMKFRARLQEIDQRSDKMSGSKHSQSTRLADGGKRIYVSLRTLQQQRGRESKQAVKNTLPLDSQVVLEQKQIVDNRINKNRQIVLEQMVRAKDTCIIEEVDESSDYDVNEDDHMACTYEMMREETIQKNKAKMVELGLKQAAESFGTSQFKYKKKKSIIDYEDQDEDGKEYIPHDPINETEPLTTIKETKSDQKKNDDTRKSLPRRMTRSQAKLSSEISKNENEAIPSQDKEDLRQPDLEKSIVKQLQLNKNQGIGSMAKFLEMRSNQNGISEKIVEMTATSGTQREAASPQDEPKEGIKEVKTRRYRGQTKLDAIHTRKFEDRKKINLNEDYQPTHDTEEEEKTLTEFSNFLGTLAKQYVRLDHISWHKVLYKDQLWDFVQQKYIISEMGRPWVMDTIRDSWRAYKSRIKSKYFMAYDNDEDRRENRPEFISTQEFETLLLYWNDDKVKQLAEKNSCNRKQVRDHHTCGPVGFARIRKKLKLEKPNQEEPSKAEVFIATRKRKEGHQYKETNSATDEKIAMIEQKLSGGETFEIEELLGENSSHGRSWLVGRVGHMKKKKDGTESSTITSKTNISEEAIEQIKVELREEVKNEVKEEMEKTKAMQAQLANMIQKLSEMNPALKLNLNGVLVSPPVGDDE